MKINMGCGTRKLEGYVNLDGEDTFAPDVVHDLESFPWPFDDNAAEEVVFNHVLEHLGETSKVFLGIMSELYRICAPSAQVVIKVPHPRHDDFINDPTHVRPVTPEMLALFDLELNREWQQKGGANSKLAMALGVDFSIEQVAIVPEKVYQEKLDAGELTLQQIANIARKDLNVIRETIILLRARK